MNLFETKLHTLAGIQETVSSALNDGSRSYTSSANH